MQAKTTFIIGAGIAWMWTHHSKYQITCLNIGTTFKHIKSHNSKDSIDATQNLNHCTS